MERVPFHNGIPFRTVLHVDNHWGAKQFLKVDPFCCWMQMSCKANRPRDKTKKVLMGWVSTCVDLKSDRVLSRAFYDTSTCNLKNEEFDLRLNILESLLPKKRAESKEAEKSFIWKTFFATSLWSKSYALKRIQLLQSCWWIDKVCCCHDLFYT